MARYVKVGESWRSSPMRYRKVNGEWKQVIQSYVKVNGVWRQTANQIGGSRVIENAAAFTGTVDCGRKSNGKYFTSLDGTPNDSYNPLRVGVRLQNIPSGHQYVEMQMAFNNSSPGMVYFAYRTPYDTYMMTENAYNGEACLLYTSDAADE